MCDRCNPRICRGVPITPAIEEAAERIRALYALHSAGGRAHIVTDDFNVDDEHVEWCLRDLAENGAREDDQAMVRLSRATLEALRPLTRLQRIAAVHVAEGTHPAQVPAEMYWHPAPVTTPTPGSHGP
jgi:DNA repair photolyase